jgi:hypothetical protein
MRYGIWKEVGGRGCREAQARNSGKTNRETLSFGNKRGSPVACHEILATTGEIHTVSTFFPFVVGSLVIPLQDCHFEPGAESPGESLP